MIKNILIPTSVALLTVALLLSPNAAVGQTDIADLTTEMDKAIFDSTVFAQGYVTLSAYSEIKGNVVAGAAITVGANADIKGTLDSGAASTLGAGVKIRQGDVYSGAATTLGAFSVVQGNVIAGAATTLGAGATIYQHDLAYATNPDSTTVQFLGESNVGWTSSDKPQWGGMIDGTAGELEGAQSYLYDLQPSTPPIGTTNSMYSGITHNIGTDQTWLPGVYTIDGSLSVSATVIITLDNSTAALDDDLENFRNSDDSLTNPEGVFIINVRDYVSFGAKTKIVWADTSDDAEYPSVIWNVPGTYISLGAEAEIEGLLLANTYVATGAKSCVKGGAYSATSYVVVGAVAKINRSCQNK
jgi:hypothetical protein